MHKIFYTFGRIADIIHIIKAVGFLKIGVVLEEKE